MRWRGVLIGVSLVSQLAAAPRSLTGKYSDYEQRAIEGARRALNGQPELAPEGKLVESIDFVRLPPIESRDGLPLALNVVHWTSQPWVLRRELRVREGDRWHGVLVDESARNLRRRGQLSVVLCVPFAGSAPDRVRLVVITKDVWSLYVDFDLGGNLVGLEKLKLEPKESNVAGLHQLALGRLTLDPATVAIGGRYFIPRLDGRLLELDADVNLIVNRSTGLMEGFYGAFSSQRPMFSGQTRWSWSVRGSAADRITRAFFGAQLLSYTQDGLPGSIPRELRERIVEHSAAVTRSFGWETKHDVTLSMGVRHASFAVPQPSRYDPELLLGFTRQAVPTSENRVGPSVTWRTYSSDFLRTFDLATLGLQEDARLGHDLWIRVSQSFRALYSTRDVASVSGGAGYSAALSDGLLRVAAETTVESALDSTTRGVSDAWVKGTLGIATPRLGWGRIVYKTSVLNRLRNWSNSRVSVPSGELRGYPTSNIVGEDSLSTNLELRSRSVQLGPALLGAVAFYDVADAFDGFEKLRPKTAVGTGLRILFPQVDRIVFRLDFAVPVLAGPRGEVDPFSVSFAFHQGWALPAVGP